MTRLLVAAVLAGTLGAAGHAQTQSVARGRVVSADTGEALAHARVIIYNDAAPLAPIYTDGQGQFTSPALAAGRYRLTTRKAGYALTTVSQSDFTFDAEIVVRMPRAASIAGRVIDGFGEPSTGVLVSLYTAPAAGQPGPGTLLKRIATDDAGEYRFGGLPEGSYLVAAMTPVTAQFATAEALARIPPNSFDINGTFFPGARTIADAERIALHPGDERIGIDFAGINSQADTFTMASMLVVPTTPIVTTQPNGSVQVITPRPVTGQGSIRGTVTRTDGTPLAHATVTTRAPEILNGFPNGGRRIGTRMVYSDEYGRYELADLPPGEYRINAAKLGYTSSAYGQSGDDTSIAMAQSSGTPVQLQEGQTKTRVDISLPRYSAVVGRVLDEFGDPVENVNVNIAEIKFQAGRRRLVGAPGVTSRATDDLGRFRMYGLVPGQYIIYASAGQVQPNQPPSDLSGYAPTYFPGTTNAREAQFVPVVRSQDVTGLDFVLTPTPTSTISGTKVGSDGAPLGGSLILVESQRSGAIITPPTGARIQDDGRFEFPNVAPGEYVIQADRGRVGSGVEGDFVAQYVAVNGGNVGDLLLQASPGSTINGRVVLDGDGEPPSLRTLAIIPERADLDLTPNAGSIARAGVASDLTFSITGVHGPRRFRIENPAPGWDLKAVLANGIDITDMPVKFGTPDESISDLQVVLTNRLTEVTASVVDANGRPTRDFTLLIFPQDRERWYPASRYFRRAGPDTSGAAIVHGLPAGDYVFVPVFGWRVLRDGVDAWQDPEFLEALASRGTRASLAEGQRLSISTKVITP